MPLDRVDAAFFSIDNLAPGLFASGSRRAVCGAALRALIVFCALNYARLPPNQYLIKITAHLSGREARERPGIIPLAESN